jgi:hypothetical protein
MCSVPVNWTLVHINATYSLGVRGNASQIMADIMMQFGPGPVEAAFEVFEDFI